ncbi:MAG: hypothetical protein AAF581_09610 [Planctomycetota bacterium]
MAVRTTCSNCKQSFSAQDEYIGKKLKCPSCGTRVAIMKPEEVQAKKAWQDEQDQRIALIEKMSNGGGAAPKTDSYAAEFGTGVDRVRNFNPGALSRFRKLRALSRFLILMAYLLVGGVLLGAGLAIFLYHDGIIASPLTLTLILGGGALFLLFAFSLFKFLGEMSWLLADLGDHQLDVRNLLIDIREEADRLQTPRR